MLVTTSLGGRLANGEGGEDVSKIHQVAKLRVTGVTAGFVASLTVSTPLVILVLCSSCDTTEKVCKTRSILVYDHLVVFRTVLTPDLWLLYVCTVLAQVIVNPVRTLYYTSCRSIL
jgi:hypothetical protein